MTNDVGCNGVVRPRVSLWESPVEVPLDNVLLTLRAATGAALGLRLAVALGLMLDAVLGVAVGDAIGAALGEVVVSAYISSNTATVRAVILKPVLHVKMVGVQNHSTPTNFIASSPYQCGRETS